MICAKHVKKEVCQLEITTWKTLMYNAICTNIFKDF